MKASIANHVLLTLPSAALFIGTTVGELYEIFSNKPPERLSIMQCHKISGDKIKSGEHTNKAWFDGPAAMHEPLLKNTLDWLITTLIVVLQQLFPETPTETVDTDFRENLPIQHSLGGILETLRVIMYKNCRTIKSPAALMEKLSYAGFFDL